MDMIHSLTRDLHLLVAINSAKVLRSTCDKRQANALADVRRVEPRLPVDLDSAQLGLQGGAAITAPPRGWDSL
jgi:hypothetical protein